MAASLQATHPAKVQPSLKRESMRETITVQKQKNP
jgi:hypothetical protein